MNIFCLHVLAASAAKLHVAKLHPHKMALEALQLLFGAYHFHLPDLKWPNADLKVYRASHSKHPMAVWVRSSKVHWLWTLDLASALVDVFDANLRRNLDKNELRKQIDRFRKMGPPENMPDDCSYNEFIGTLSAVKLSTKRKRDDDGTRFLVASKNVPLGCSCFPLCIGDHDDDFAKRYFTIAAESDDPHGSQFDAVQVYRKYYRIKLIFNDAIRRSGQWAAWPEYFEDSFPPLVALQNG